MAEKSLNETPRDLRPLFTKGNDALQRDNFDYAIALFKQVLSREPGLHEVRKALRTAELKKAGTGKSFFKKMLSGASAQPLVAKGELALLTNPTEALGIAEQILESDPQSAAGHRLLVKAAVALEMPNTAVLSLEILHRTAPEDVEVALQLGKTLADIGDVARGETILTETAQLVPTNAEVSQALKDLSARKTLKEGGYQNLEDGTGSYRDILKDKEEAALLEQQNRAVKNEDTTERLIREYEGRLQSEPKNVKLLRDLAELYTQKQQFDVALGYYGRIKASELGADASLDGAIAQTTIKKFEHQMAQLDPNAPDYAEQSARLQAERDAYQLAECQKRVERFPTDLQLRFELGQLYFQLGKIGEATAEFQKAQNNPNKRIAAMNYLAQCFAKRKMYDLAARRLQEAIKEKPVLDEEKKELIYNLGSVLESMGKKDEAIDQYKLIYEVDISYKDVAKKVEDFYSGQS